MRPKAEIETFASDWVAQNLRGLSTSTSLPHELDSLAAHLTRDARAQGISGSDLNRAVGDIDDYLTEQIRRQPGTG